MSVRRWLVVLALAAVASTTMALVIGGGADLYVPVGVQSPGVLVAWGLPLMRLVATAAATATVGLLLYSAVLGPHGRQGVLSKIGRADAVKAAVAATIWSGAALVTALLSVAWALALPLWQALSPSVLMTYAGELASVRAYLIVALTAAVIAAGLVFTASVSAAAGWLLLALIAVALPALTGHASGLGDHGLAITSDVAHAVAVPLWIGGLIVIVWHGWRGDPGTGPAVKAFRVIASWAFAILAVSGLGAAYARMSSVSQLWTTGFGQLVLVKIVLLAMLLVTARNLQTRVGAFEATAGRREFLRFASIEAVLMAVAAGVGVALTQTPYPRIDAPLGSPAEELLGYPFPPPPTAMNVVFGWRTEPLFLALAIVAIGLYAGAVVRLHRRGDRWSAGRTAAWIAGWLAVIWATNAGVAVYATVTMTWHMVTHMAMGMFAPILMAMAAPMTLALRALPASTGPRRGPREWLVWGMHTKLARFVTHPVYVLIIFTVGLYGVYYTPLFSWLMPSHIGHVAMQLHFLLSGYLFAWVVIQTDPLPRTLPPWARLIMVLMAMVLHAFFAVPIMMSATAFGAAWYSQVQPPWLADLVKDSQTAGGVAWGIAEIPSLLLVIAVGVQWAKSDSREAIRRDRRVDRDGDAELDAYNERLRRMAERPE